MAVPHVIVVVPVDLAHGLRRRLPDDATVQVLTVAEVPGALDLICASAPGALLLDPGFAMTSRGAALIGAVKQAPELTRTELRALSREHLERETLDRPLSTATLLRASRPLEQWGTRSAARFRMHSAVTVKVNGEAGTLLNLSVTGAQVIAPVRLIPTQPVRLVLADDEADARCRAVVAWSTIAAGQGIIAYRAGLFFTHAIPELLEGLCRRHGHRL